MTTDTHSADLLGNLLKNVSRSFYLSLCVLPDGMREPVGLAYLIARAADTIADTALVAPDRRVALLTQLRENVEQLDDGVSLSHALEDVTRMQTDSHEHVLLGSIPPMLALLRAQTDADSAAIRKVVATLTSGMEFDLRTFPDEQSGQVASLPTYDMLDRYTYLVAGCVGEFWTDMTGAHTCAARSWDFQDMFDKGIQFGKALQMTNILRDCAKDLPIGRCYLPDDVLAAHGLGVSDLMQPGASTRARGVLIDLLRVALDQYRDACLYTLAIPRRFVRLRLACLWPILIGLETLELLAGHDAWLDPTAPAKVPRKRVYQIMVLSLLIIGSNVAIETRIARLIASVDALAQIKAPAAC
ncbi:farnesyl-diphosphate farnesyltransferase [Burkholderia pseudomultivorans]|uniref:phytoene/squalene synthase family protein n=1 Tax=Burkholderia cepacia complex TaxID=87882 RepID=UPI000755EEDB|nr:MULTISPECIES: phytoene/squalene synthase family protein [Burkholderia cepacia complex]AOI86319.1 farnesyl-diphosphate farnesyltransferase [Burkholderia cepacia]AOI87927.1 farnesyl-diphosphate farnesyltransferase [Burkholderia pseudomultivorans]KVC20706.1 farnesyl-diphosphate farnesyltransferase [Burkholderia pseudomultivorans]KVC44235.1 farnesyl-diphosphate farnesyltransferase [Burkholderia pseudomultivorans]KVC51939.1 farnesyl-diphosphate farnesyltransferase [Burkholderia pseudomultivorans